MLISETVIMGNEERRALYDQFLRCLDREENLIHYRISWGLQWNIALFTAICAIMFTSKSDFTCYIISIIVSTLGILISLSSFVGVRAAHVQSQFLIDTVEKKLSIENCNWSKSEFLRPYGEPHSTHENARKVSAFFPLPIIVLWLFFIIYAFQHAFSPQIG